MNRVTLHRVACDAIAASLAVAFVPVASAQVVLDGSLGRAGALAGPNFSVTADLGRQVGANLFHSFSQFGLAQGQSATFSGPATIANVISRVTGGAESLIDGRIRSTIAGADFYFFNPAGIAFGPNASIDVGGAFHASSAHYLRLADGGRFDAASPAGSTLTAAAPEAFGFLGGQGGIIVDGASLQTRVGSAFTLSGGDLGIGNGAWIDSPSGAVGLASVSGPGTVAIGPDGIGGVTGSRGTIVLYDGHILTDSEGARASGPIRIVGGDIAIAGDADVRATNSSDSSGGGITIDATGTLLLSNGWVSTNSYDLRGSAGDIRITAPTLVLQDESSIVSNTLGPGRSGNVDIAAHDVLVTGQSRINASSWGDGDAGNVRVVATGGVRLEDSGNISATSWYSGNSGDIEVRADVLAIEQGFIASTVWDTGRGGTINLDVGELRLNDGFVSASASLVGSGDAGDVIVRASRSVTIEGFMGMLSSTTYSSRGGNVFVTSPLVTIGPYGGITSRTMGTGNAGTVHLDVGDLVMGDFSHISADSSSDATGNGGSIDIRASGTVTVATGPFGGIDASTLGSGNGGSIVIDAGRVEVLDGKINAVTQGTGNAGSITIHAAEGVLVDAGRLIGGIETSSRGAGNGGSLEIVTPELVIRNTGGLAASTSETGSGGSIRIEADRVVLTESGQIRSYTLGPGRAGSLEIHAGEIGLSGGAQILAYTAGEGAGGDVILRGDRAVRIVGEGPPRATTGILASSLGAGPGGNVIVSAPLVQIADVGFITAGTDGNGRGGSVNISAGEFVVSSLGFVDVSTSGAGAAGSLVVRATDSVTVTGFDATVGAISGLSGGSSGSGAGGTIAIAAPRVVVDDGAGVSSIARAEGRGGSITIDAGELRILGGAGINASSLGSGAAGDVTVNATDRILLQGGGYGYVSGIGAESGASGAGGHVFLAAPAIEIRDGALVTAQAYSTGTAGSIRVSAGDSLVMTNGASIATRTALSDGGNISIDGRGVVNLHGGSITTSVQGGAGDGGNIAISGPQHVVLNDGQIQANAYGGNGGNITIDSAYFLASPRSVVEASSQLGVSGTITVTAPVVDVGAGLGTLPSGFFDASRLLREACASRAGEAENSFVVVGRGAMPESAWGSYSAPRPREDGRARVALRPAASPCGGSAW